jgi:hypothetical protein
MHHLFQRNSQMIDETDDEIQPRLEQAAMQREKREERWGECGSCASKNDLVEFEIIRNARENWEDGDLFYL